MEKQQDNFELTYFLDQIRKINADFAEFKYLASKNPHVNYSLDVNYSLNMNILHSLLVSLVEGLTDEQKAQLNPRMETLILELEAEILSKTSKVYRENYNEYCKKKKGNNLGL